MSLRLHFGQSRVYHVAPYDPADRIQYRYGFTMQHIDFPLPPPVANKRDFYRRFYAGEFGNHGPMWATVPELLASGHRGPVAIRCQRRGGRCDYDVPLAAVERRVRSFVRSGYAVAELNFSAMAPHEDQTLQGEVCRLPGGLHLHGSFVRAPMRPSLAQGGFCLDGLAAQQALRRWLDASSYDWLMGLLDRYPDHVVEFSSFRRPWGVVPGLNTAIWEVRGY